MCVVAMVTWLDKNMLLKSGFVYSQKIELIDVFKNFIDKFQNFFNISLNRCLKYLPAKCYEILLSGSWKTRALPRKSRWSKNHPFTIFDQLRMRCIYLGSRSHDKNPARFPDFLHLETLSWVWVKSLGRGQKSWVVKNH